jgi:hypothetical protein
MANLVHGMRKKSLLRLVFLFAVALLAIILIRGFVDRKPDLGTPEGRQAYLRDFGWEIDLESESHKSVRIPASLDGIIADYNEMQLEQGCDLSKHLGETCEQYSYTVTNYPDPSQTVLITLYVQGNTMIAGDVHSTALNGFMQGLKQE